MTTNWMYGVGDFFEEAEPKKDEWACEYTGIVRNSNNEFIRADRPFLVSNCYFGPLPGPDFGQYQANGRWPLVQNTSPTSVAFDRYTDFDRYVDEKLKRQQVVRELASARTRLFWLTVAGYPIVAGVAAMIARAFS
jgi:hypothetical protein